MTAWEILAHAAFETAEVIGHKCGARGGDCLDVACVEIHWPGAPVVPMCWNHRTEALRVADVFGIHITGRILEVKLRNQPPPDDSALRFAAMELE